ncbi:MAG: MFS transporter, partial [Ktedonobacterales bacterium]
AVFVLVLPDPALPKGTMPPFKLWRFILSFWINPKKYPDFGWAWLTRFLVILGYSTAIGSFLYFFIKDGLHYETLFPKHKPDEGVALVQIVAVAFLLVSSVVGGILSDRFQRRKLFVIVSTVIISLALVMLSFYTLYPPALVWPLILVAGAIVGFGFGAYLGVDLALVTQVLPSAHDRGKDMGVFNIANALPNALAPILGAKILGLTGNNYSIMFAVAAVIVLLGAILVQPIRSVR